MSVTQYIGARYVPLFADPIDWDINSAYEPLTIVYYQGNSYTSKQAVPTNVEISNTDYWALTGNYNAQIEQYRREVQTFDGRITANAQAIADEVTARMQKDTEIRELIASVNSSLATETSNREAADSTLSARIGTLENAQRFMVVIGDSFSNSQGGYSGTPYWHAYVAKALGVTVKNFASGSTGFIAPSNLNRNFLTQINEASTDSSFANAQVSHVIIYGGVNDGTTLTTEDVFNVIKAAEDAFPNAEVFTFFNYNARNDTMAITRRVIINNLKLTHGRSAHTLWLCERCSEFYGGSSGSDPLHPSESGSRLIAGEMLTNITGGRFDILSNAREITCELLTSGVNYTAEIRGAPHVAYDGVHALVQLTRIDSSITTPFTGDIQVLVPNVLCSNIQGTAADHTRHLAYTAAGEIKNVFYDVSGTADGTVVTFTCDHLVGAGFMRAEVVLNGE